jgi:hypothetical protein
MHPTQNPVSPAYDGPTPADTLRGAALYLERHGWTQGDYYDYSDTDGTGSGLTPKACAHGAIAIAAYGSPVEIPSHANRAERPDFAVAAAIFDDYIRVVVAPTTDDPDDLAGIWWNDADGRTATEVIAALRAAADDYDRATTRINVRDSARNDARTNGGAR